MEEQLRRAIEAEGWKISESEQDGNSIAELERFSPTGEDFVISVWHGTDGSSTEDFCSSLDELCKNYDVDYETYIWLGNDGHGMNGAPYHIKDILTSKEWCLNKMKELSARIRVKFNINKNEEGD